MKVLEIEGKTIDEAIDKACREFDVPREKLNIEILSEGSSGFLGLVGTKKAKIKASLLSLDMSFELPKEKKERAPEATAAPKPQEPREHREQREQHPPREQREQRPPRENREQREHRPPRENRAPREQRDHRPPREQRDSRPPREHREPREARPPREHRETQTPREPRPEPVASSPEALAAAKETLLAILALMKIEAQVTVEDTPEAISLTLQGADEGLLIGKTGADPRCPAVCRQQDSQQAGPGEQAGHRRHGGLPQEARGGPRVPGGKGQPESQKDQETRHAGQHDGPREAHHPPHPAERRYRRHHEPR